MGRVVDTQFIVGSKIRIENPTRAVMAYCKGALVIENPEYAQRVRLGKWLGGTPRTIWLYETQGNAIIVPFGCLHDLWRLHPVKKDWSLQFHPVRRVDYNSTIKLWDYQKPAVAAIISQKNGVLVMPCGSGKTQTALEAVARFGMRALWITHTKELLDQSMSRAKRYFDIPQNCFGTITEGKINVSTHITFSTVQTLQRVLREHEEYRNYWDVVVVDECHKAIGAPSRVMMFYDVLSRLNARYKIGMTATPERSDGFERAMYALLGRKIYEVPKEAVEGHTVPVVVRQIPTGYNPPLENITNPDGTINFSMAQKDMVKNELRNMTIAAHIEALLRDGQSVLVLSDRVGHLGALRGLLGKELAKKCAVLNGKTPKRLREHLIDKVRDGEVQALFATYQLAKEGLDIPRLNSVVLAMPKKDYATVVQSAGRCARKFDGKSAGYVYDFIDDFGMYYRMQRDRLAHYRKAGFVVEKI